MEDQEPRLGYIRHTQHSNTLLVRPEIGRSRRTVYDLPSLRDTTFTYGRVTPAEGNGVRTALTSWAAHDPRLSPSKSFTHTSRSPILGAHASPTNPNRQKMSASAEMKKLKGGFLPSDMDGHYSYGRCTSGMQSMDLLLSHHYQREWLDVMSHKERTVKKESQEQHARRDIRKATKASMGHQHIAPPPPKEPFKMKRFGSVPPRVDCTRPHSAPPTTLPQISLDA